MKKTQLYYYSNELEDEFSKAKIMVSVLVSVQMNEN